MYLLRFMVTIGLLVSSMYGYANSEVDSLKQLLLTQSPDTNRVTILNKLAWRVRSSDPDQAMEYLGESAQLASSLDYTFGLGKSLSHQGTVLVSSGDFTEGITKQKAALLLFLTTGLDDEVAKCYNKLGIAHYGAGDTKAAIEYYAAAVKHFKNPVGVANSSNNLALVYQGLGKYSEAIDYFIRASKAFEVLNQPRLVAASYNNIALLYGYQENPEKSEAYAREGLRLAREIQDDFNTAQALGNLGICFEAYGRLEESLDHHFTAFELFSKIGARKQAGISLNNISSVYTLQGRLAEASEKHQEALNILQAIGAKKEIAAVLNNIGEGFYQVDQLDSALDYFLKAHTLAKEAGELHFLLVASKNLAIVHEKLDNYEQSLAYQKQYSEINAKLLEAENEQLTIETEAKYQSQRKESTIAEQELEINTQTKVIIWSMVGLVVALIALGFIIRAFMERRKVAKNLEEEKAFINLEKEELETVLKEKEEVLKNLRDRAVYKQETLPEHFDQLSKREVEVLLLVGEGLRDREIADQLYISVTTVRTHIRRIYDKLLVKNRAETVNIVHRYDINALMKTS